ncbi:MAG: hypothetical protein Q9210_003082 [Variospora velana]
MLLDTINWCSRTFTDDELTLLFQVAEAPVQQLWHDLQHQEQGSMYGPTSYDRDYAFSLTISAGRAGWRAADDGPAEDDPILHRSVYREYQSLINWDRRPRNDGSTMKVDPHGQISETSLQMYAHAYMVNQRRALTNRRFFLTSKGFYGVAHNTLEVGDTCIVIRGANVPFVIRKAGCVGQDGNTSNRYRLIGESYIHGIMRGELFDRQANGIDNQRGGLAEETIHLV